jgi:hypothetical protein
MKKRALGRNCAATAALLFVTFGAVCAEEGDVLSSLLTKLRRQPHPQLGAANWDILDYPQEPTATLMLEDARHPGERVNLTEKLVGKIAVLVEVNRDAGQGSGVGWGQWTAAHGTPQAVEAYRKAYEQYTPKGVVFVAIWKQGTGYKATAAKDAAAYAQKHKLPGLLVVDQPSDLGRKGAFYTYISSGTPGHPPHSVVCILSANGKIVYRGEEKQFGFGYHVTKLILDRLLDPKYDEAVRREFYPERDRELPSVEKTAHGLTYREDFETYADDHDFRLQPRWGFEYQLVNQQTMAFGGTIEQGAGRNQSQAVMMTGMAQADVLHPNRRWSWATHAFPASLRDGHFRFFLRRGPRVNINWTMGKPPLCRILVSGFDENGQRQPGLTTTSQWKAERFKMISHHGKDPENVRQLKRIEKEILKQLKGFLSKLKETREDDGNLLERTAVLLVSSLGNASNHSNKSLPVLLAGGRFEHGRHLRFDPPDTTPLCNVFVSILQQLGIQTDSFSTSTGHLDGLQWA